VGVSLRPTRRTNLALLVLLTGAFLTGLLAFAFGGRTAAEVVALLHGSLGLGIVLLAPWKTVIARRGLRRRREHGSALALAVVVAVCLASGVVHATLGSFAVAGITLLSLHVASGVAIVPLTIAHVVRRPQRPRITDLSRRHVLRGAGLGGAALLAYGAVESVTTVVGLPGADRRATGSYEVGSGVPSAVPVTQWFTDGVQDVDVGAYSLLVEQHDAPSRRVSYPQLLSMTATTTAAVLDCTGGWWSEQTWRGVPLSTLLGPLEHGSIAVRSVTGYTRRFPVEDAGALLLATHVGGIPLSTGHGAPVRLVAPGRRGFWWVKWVDRVSVDTGPSWWQPPFPLQ
jgi:DMSO/TMAO reductase YedYZ molybdopterin-dependent catalytic subunit